MQVVTVPIWVLRHQDLSQGAKLAYGVLCAHAGGTAPDEEKLGALLGVKRRQAATYIAELRALGLLETVPGGRRGNRYLLADPAESVQHPASSVGDSVQDTASFPAGEGATVQHTAPFTTEQTVSVQHPASQGAESVQYPASYPAPLPPSPLPNPPLVPPTPTGECVPAPTPPAPAPSADRAGLFFDYFGRFPGGQEPYEISQLFEDFPGLTAQQWQAAIVEARGVCTEKTGKNPRNLSWLRNTLADLTNPVARKERTNGRRVDSPSGGPPPEARTGPGRGAAASGSREAAGTRRPSASPSVDELIREWSE